MCLQEEAQQTTADCGHFSMPVPDFSELDMVATDIAETKVRVLPSTTASQAKLSLCKLDVISELNASSPGCLQLMLVHG